MTSTATSSTSSPALTATTRSARQQFLDLYEREHAITMRMLRAFPPEHAELRPHPKLKSARELAFVFVLERGLGTAALANAFAAGMAGAGMPALPDSWEAVLAAIEQAHADFRDTINGYTDEQLLEPVKFFVAPHTLGDFPRIDHATFLVHDQIHHRGQLSVYLRMADGKVPSIYGPTADEPWM
jgi:uncharacterized damage-inducible protein DinB